MQRTALYNSRKTETQLKSENNFIVEGEMLVSACQRCLPIKKKVSTTNKRKNFRVYHNFIKYYGYGHICDMKRQRL